jgi:hypothetical protein
MHPSDAPTISSLGTDRQHTTQGAQCTAAWHRPLHCPAHVHVHVPHPPGLSVQAISHIVALLTEDRRFGMQSGEDINKIKAVGAVALDMLGLDLGLWGWKHLHLFQRMWLGNVMLPHIHIEGLGYIPVMLLVGGTCVCL